jgi:hypothetical protein
MRSVVWEGHVEGVFEGYGYDRVYELSDGSRFEQKCPTSEGAYRKRPRARLYRDEQNGAMYLDVEGTSYTVRVRRLGWW